MIRQTSGGLNGVFEFFFLITLLNLNKLLLDMLLLKVEMLQFVQVTKNKRLQTLGVRCVKGCPFRIFASSDRKTTLYVMKTVNGQHT